jgi:mono/diheme cytochrome c family protein
MNGRLGSIRRVWVLATMVVASAAPVLTAAQAKQATRPQGPDGAALYRVSCASCHGTSGRGDGPMADYLRVAPTDLTRLAQRHGGTYRADAVARAIDGRDRIGSHGPSDMLVWGDAFSPSLRGGNEAALRARISALVQYVATLQQQPAE